MSKAICVDGASFSWMRASLGACRYNFQQLCRLLRGIGKEPEVYKEPIYVVNTSLASKIGAAVEGAGFHLEIRDGYQEDDRCIIDFIKSLPPEVREIILVSADSDYIEALMSKQDLGVAIYIVATNNVAVDENPMVGYSLKNLCDTGFFTFVELSKHEEIILRRSDPIGLQIQPVSAVVAEQKLFFEIIFKGGPSEVGAFVTNLMTFLGDHPKIQVKITN